MIVFSYLLPLAVNLIRLYLSNSDSSRDHKVLELLQDSCSYLYQKDNNTVDSYTVANVLAKKIL